MKRVAQEVFDQLIRDQMLRKHVTKEGIHYEISTKGLNMLAFLLMRQYGITEAGVGEASGLTPNGSLCLGFLLSARLGILLESGMPVP